MNFKDAAAACCKKAVDMAQKCLLGGCLTWMDWLDILNWLKTQYANNELAPVLTEIVTSLTIYTGLKGKQGVFQNTPPMFFSILGTMISIIVGSLAGAYAGWKTISYAVKGNYWGNNGYGSTFYTYGSKDNGLIGDFLGMFETSWVVMFLLVAIGLALAPYYLAMELENYMSKVSLTGDAAAEDAYRHLTNGLLIALSSWASAWTLSEAGDRLVGWFDMYNTDAEGQVTMADKTLSYTNNDAVLADVGNHTLVVLFYFLMSLTIGGSGWAYVYYQYTDPEWIGTA